MGLTVELEHPVGHCPVSAVTGEHVAVPAVFSPQMSGTVSPLVKPLLALPAGEVCGLGVVTARVVSQLVPGLEQVAARPR